MQVMGGGHASTHINPYNVLPNVGNVRYNAFAQRMEVYDGNNWGEIYMGSVNIGLNHEAESLLDWAKQKRYEEEQLKIVMEHHPGLKDLYYKFEMMKILCYQEHKQEKTI